MLESFDPLPGPQIQKKIDYFFLPYAPKQERCAGLIYDIDKNQYFYQMIRQATREEDLEPTIRKEVEEFLQS